MKVSCPAEQKLAIQQGLIGWVLDSKLGFAGTSLDLMELIVLVEDVALITQILCYLIPGGGESSRRYHWGTGSTSPAATPCRVSRVGSMRAPCQGHSPLACSLGPLSHAESPKLVRSRSPHLRVPRGHCPLSDLKRSSKREEELKQAKVWSEYRLPKRVL